MSGFHIDTFDGVMGKSYYAVDNATGAETKTYAFRWMAWFAGKLGLWIHQ